MVEIEHTPVPGYRLGDRLWADENVALHRATRLDDGAPFLLRLLTSRQPSTAQQDAMRREQTVLQSLDSSHVPRLIEVAADGAALVLEDFDAEPLSGVLAADNLPLKTQIQLAVKLAMALGAVHEAQLLHHDLHPGHILVNMASGTLRLVGFGLAAPRLAGRALHADHVSPRGRPAYLAPERTGRTPDVVDHRADLYSAGVTLYQMFTGTLPFTETDEAELLEAHLLRAPPRPEEQRPELPDFLSGIILKLLAKTPPDRYQTALGLQRDLEHGLGLLDCCEPTDGFDLGTWDVSRQLAMTDRLYGRDAEIEQLRATFQRVADGPSEAILIAGPPGAGKSTLAHTLFRPVIEAGGYLVVGKFEHLYRGRPYAVLADAFGRLVRQRLTEPEARLTLWRRQLADALQDEGQVIVDVIPEVEQVVGPQPPLPALSPAESAARFRRRFRAFVKSLTCDGTPLVVFFDDLHWADAATLRAVHERVSDRTIRHLMLVGTVEEAELSEFHPLPIGIRELDAELAPPDVIRLSPLTLEQVRGLVAETLHADAAAVEELAQVVVEQTGGNPFEARQLLLAIHREGLIWFDEASDRWSWNVAAIGRLDLRAPVHAVVAGRVGALPEATRDLIAVGACLGHQFNLRTLSLATGEENDTTLKRLMPAAWSDLIAPIGACPLGTSPAEDSSSACHVTADSCDSQMSFGFRHDRLQQVIYGGVPVAKRRQIHRQIGQRLVEHLRPIEREARIFEIVYHLGQAMTEEDGTIVGTDEARYELARLNQVAARRARAATAFGTAFEHLDRAATLLPVTAWGERYGFTYALCVERLDAALASGAHETAEQLVDALLLRARTPVQQASLHKMAVKVRLTTGRPAEAFELAREALAQLGLDLPADTEAAQRQIGALGRRIQSLVAGRSLDELADAPPLRDPKLKLMAELMRLAVPAAWFVNPEVALVLGSHLVEMSLEHGFSPATATGFAVYPPRPRGDKRTQFEARDLARQVAERFGDRWIFGQMICIAIPAGGFIGWDLNRCVRLARRGFVACVDNGDRVYAAFNAVPIVLARFIKGDPLELVADDAARYLEFMRTSEYVDVADAIDVLRGCAERLAGTAPNPSPKLERADYSSAGQVRCVAEMRAGLVMGDLEAAAHWAKRSAELVVQWEDGLVVPQHYFLAGMIAAATADEADPTPHVATLEEALAALEPYVDGGPSNFIHTTELVGAELARLLGHEQEALERYTRATQAARDVGYVHDEALANERAGYFCQKLGLDRIAASYLSKSRALYERWGARPKVEAMEAQFGAWLDAPSPSAAGLLTPNRSQTVDLAAIARAAEAFSVERDIDSMLGEVLGALLDSTAAGRAALICEQGGDLMVTAEVAVGEAFNRDTQGTPLSSCDHLPAAIIQHVARHRTSVHVNDVTPDHPLFQEAQPSGALPRSLLCTPALHQNKLVAIFYLENAVQAGVFDPAHLQLVGLLSAQAAAAIENSRLYARLEQTQTSLRQANDRLTEYARALEKEVEEDQHPEETVGKSPAFQALLQRVGELARTDTAVLIVGEGGTGKELLARKIHRAGRRRDGAFVKVACRRLSSGEELVRLFQSDSFDGDAADAPMGRVELAHGGTLYLDEVEALPLPTQDRLRRVLEENTLQMGGEGPLQTIDVRVVAATRVDLSAEVEAGRFREDLYYHLAIFPLHVPPLRERRQDIPQLAEHIVGKLAHKLHKPFERLTPEALERLIRYRWPGNITELQNVLERAALVARGTVIQVDEALELGLDGAASVGSYRLIERIGAGGMGEVWRGRHQMLRRPAAIKLVLSEAIDPADNTTNRDQQLRRFEREAQATAALRSPHTVELFDFGVTESGSLYYVMELLDGLDLQRLVERFGPLRPERVIYLLRQICRSLAEAHNAGLIHRDIKAANVFVCRMGIEHDYVKVLDFGLVKSDPSQGNATTQLTVEGSIRGTPAYMAPEMALGGQNVDGRADIYAVGCLGYWLITGQQVFEAPSVMALIFKHIQTPPDPPSVCTELDVPPALDAAILACLAKSPDDRPADVRALDRMLAAISVKPEWDIDRAEQWWATHLPA